VQVRAILITDRQAGIAGHRGPVAEIQVLGNRLVHHIAAQLRRNGIDEVTAVESSGADDLVTTCAQELHSAAESGVDVAIILRTDTYAEVDWDAAVAHHLNHLQPLTSIVYGPGPAALPAVIVTPALVVRAEDEIPSCRRPYWLSGKEYVNRMRDITDLRRLAADALHHLCTLEIVGREVRPGIWMAHGARLEKGARLVAPVYLGTMSRVRTGAVITRGSAIEEHCVVDCGTIVENATVLPFTELGPGLDVGHAVAGDGMMHSLKRGTMVAIADTKLMRRRSRSAMARMAASAASLAAFLPKQLAFGLRGKPPVAAPVCKDAAVVAPPPPRVTRTLAPSLTVLRRYGNE
jgi:hypothetical protein